MASFFLDLDISSELLTVFFLFKFLPCPIDLDILFMGGDNFGVDLVVPVFLLLLFLSSPHILSQVCVGPDLCNHIVCLLDELLQYTYIIINVSDRVLELQFIQISSGFSALYKVDPHST